MRSFGDKNNEQVSIHYEFNQYVSIITQPRINLKNGQPVKMQFGPYKLKVAVKKHE
jgi:hypothetical protein